MFVERCDACGRRYLRDFPLPTLSFWPTGRLCSLCSFPPVGLCTDVLLDWFDTYEKPLRLQAETHAQAAGLHLCLGSSLQVQPACHYPSRRVRRRDSKLIIANLQETPLDAEATVCLRLPTDEVAETLAAGLGVADAAVSRWAATATTTPQSAAAAAPARVSSSFSSSGSPVSVYPYGTATFPCRCASEGARCCYATETR
ncbi:UNVERIFIED_CONTAM: hypothetical protein H355_004680, partial [Colinus virginianus]